MSARTHQERGALILHAELVATTLLHRADATTAPAITLATDELRALAVELYEVAVVAERLHIDAAHVPAPLPPARS